MHKNNYLREYHSDDISMIENIFIRSMWSIMPSYFDICNLLLNNELPSIYIIITMILFFSHRYLSYLLILGSLLFYIGIAIYIKWYIYVLNPKKHINKYKSQRSNIFVLIHDKQIVGFVSMEPYIHLNHAWVTYMFVDPLYQGRGFGLMLNEFLYEYGHKNLSYMKFSGSTSSIQSRQLKLQSKYNDILKNKLGCKSIFTLNKIKKYWWLLIYEIKFTYEYINI
jgi:GNAT superfamily N-acetyltransferase